MKLLLVVFSVCAVGRSYIQPCKLMDFEYYWRDWDVKTPVPDDAVAGGIDRDGHPTYVARSVYIKYQQKVIGNASPRAKKMWFEGDSMQQTQTKDIEILCVLNQNRLKWVVAKKGDTVNSVVGDNVLIHGGKNRACDYTVGRQRIGKGIEVGRIVICNGVFGPLGLAQNGKGWWSHDKGYEVLIYVTDQSTHT